MIEPIAAACPNPGIKPTMVRPVDVQSCPKSPWEMEKAPVPTRACRMTALPKLSATTPRYRNQFPTPRATVFAPPPAGISPGTGVRGTGDSLTRPSRNFARKKPACVVSLASHGSHNSLSTRLFQYAAVRTAGPAFRRRSRHRRAHRAQRDAHARLQSPYFSVFQ